METEDKKKEKERLQLEFTTKAMEELDKFQKLAGTTTRVETIRNAIRLYGWFLIETTPKSTIKITDENGELIAFFKVSLLTGPKL
jgi:hypothetical protein